MNSNIRFIKKNLRYRIVVRNWNCYILDTEKNILSIFFPYMFWFMKQNMYEISTETMRSLEAKEINNIELPSFRWWHLSIVVSSILITPIFDYIIKLSKLQSWTFFVLFGVIFVGVRLYIHYFSKNRFSDSKIDLTELKRVPVKIKPQLTKQYGIQMMMPLIFDIAILCSIIFYLEEPRLGFLLLFITFVPVRLVMFIILFASPALEDNSSYLTTLVDDNKNDK